MMDRKFLPEGSIIFVCGQIGSGKTTQANLLAETLKPTEHCIVVEVSDIIRNYIVKHGHPTEKWTGDRNSLQSMGPMSAHIVEHLKVLQQKEPFSKIIVSGLREFEVLHYFADDTLMWIELSLQQRYLRVKARGDAKDRDVATLSSFLRAQTKDNELGLAQIQQNVYQYLFKHQRSQSVNQEDFPVISDPMMWRFYPPQQGEYFILINQLINQ